jgi:hypothetical protein
LIANFRSARQGHKIGYCESDLRSLGIEPARMNELNDEVELRNLAANLKDSMFQDYKIAYSLKGDLFEEEAKSTIWRYSDPR